MKLRFTLPAAMFGFLSVLAGAFGAHGLRGHVSPEMLQVWETACRYMMYHALALFVLSGAAKRAPTRAVGAAAWLMIAGVVLFSGSLYALALTGVRAVGAITPIGGLLLLAGWLTIAIGAVVSKGSMIP